MFGILSSLCSEYSINSCVAPQSTPVGESPDSKPEAQHSAGLLTGNDLLHEVELSNLRSKLAGAILAVLVFISRQPVSFC